MIWWWFLDYLDFFDFLELMEEVGVLLWWRWPEVWGWVWEVVVWTLSRMWIWVVEEIMAWDVEGLDVMFVTGYPGFAESYGKTSQTVPNSFSIYAAMCFWSAWKEEVVNVVEVLTDECVEVCENLMLNPYSNERLLYILEMGVDARWGRGHELMLVGWNIFGPWEWFAITSGSVEAATLCCCLNSKMFLVL